MSFSVRVCSSKSLISAVSNNIQAYGYVAFQQMEDYMSVKRLTGSMLEKGSYRRTLIATVSALLYKKRLLVYLWQKCEEVRKGDVKLKKDSYVEIVCMSDVVMLLTTSYKLNTSAWEGYNHESN